MSAGTVLRPEPTVVLNTDPADTAVSVAASICRAAHAQAETMPAYGDPVTTALADAYSRVWAHALHPLSGGSQVVVTAPIDPRHDMATDAITSAVDFATGHWATPVEVEVLEGTGSLRAALVTWGRP